VDEERGGRGMRLKFTERLGGEPTFALLPNERRVEALFDGGPNGKRRRENDFAGSVADLRQWASGVMRGRRLV
jgi:hypothetical protein